MHLLTKLFIVLVSLLAVMITPLVAVNAVNEASFKSKWMASNQGKNAALENLDAEQKVRMAEAAAASVQVKELELRIAELQRNSDGKNAEVIDAEPLVSALGGDGSCGGEDGRHEASGNSHDLFGYRVQGSFLGDESC